MNLKQLLFLKSASGGEQNLLVYSDLVNKNYSGNPNNYNVRPEHLIAVKPGSSLFLSSMWVNETNIRFYDENETYQSAYTVTKYGEKEFTFDVPDGMHYILPKWYQADVELPVETFIESNPVIKYT